MAKNRYSRVYGALKGLAKRRKMGEDKLGLEMAKRKVKQRFKIKSFTDLSDEQLENLREAIWRM